MSSKNNNIFVKCFENYYFRPLTANEGQSFQFLFITSDLALCLYSQFSHKAIQKVMSIIFRKS